MTSIPLGKTDWQRGVADENPIPVTNRYYEDNPANAVEQVALIARPGLKRLVSVGDGPIRAMYSQTGSFNDALFVVSYDALYRVDTDLTPTLLGGGLFGASLSASPSMVATSQLGTTPAYLFLADGRELHVYTDNSSARGTLTASGTISSGYKIQLDTKYYQWTSGSVDAGTPNGSSGNPWLVALGATDAKSLSNMYDAVNAVTGAGTIFSTATKANPTIKSLNLTTTAITFLAREPGTTGNSLATVVTSGANIAFGAATLSGGGTASFNTVPLPDDVGAVSVAYLGGFVIVVCAQGDGVNGRFYWINPGEINIDPLNFATAESAPDGLISARVVGDQLYLFGYSTTEVWYLSGDLNAPFQRAQGLLYSKGIWEGTDVQLKDKLIVADSDGNVYVIERGAPQLISNPGIAERIREAIIADTLQL